MSYRAWFFIGTVLLVAVVFSLLTLPGLEQAFSEWPIFTLLTGLAVVAQLFEATNGRKSYYPHFVFFFAGLLLLSPFLFVLLVAIPHLVEWAYKRLTKSPLLRQWYIQPFNISTFLLAGFGARRVYDLLENTDLFHSSARVSLVILISLIYVGINHILIGLVLRLARNISLKDSGVLSLESLLPDIILAALGYVVAVLWSLDPWLVLPALSPLVLMYEALKVPQLKQEAQTDAKTGLLNARHFSRVFTTELDRAVRFNRPLSLIMADLDFMRNINNTYGHLAGDAVLAGIGKIIQSVIRDYDSAGRFGGEEFAIVMPETTLEGAVIVAERIRAEIAAASFEVEGNASLIQATMSLGVACFPQDATTTTNLTQAADIAVYQAKHLGRNRVAVYRDVTNLVAASSIQPLPGLEANQPTPTNQKPENVIVTSQAQATAPSLHTGSFGLEQELRRGLERDEFEVYYQPKANLKTGEIEGIEALVRWQHPLHGLIQPQEFIAVAEKTSLVCSMDFVVLEKACRQIVEWNRAKLVNTPLVVSVNFSAQHFLKPNLVERVEYVLNQTGIERGWLQLEITESVLLDGFEEAIPILKQLKNLGIQLAIDDFGTGYSSLRYLKNLPLDVLKLDRSFVTGLEEDERLATIVSAVVNLGHSLNLSVVAEGVESREECQHLHELGCDLGQGYYFSKPVPSVDLPALVKNMIAPTTAVEPCF